ncbi:MAG: ComF family protein [Lachnospiraceae bacterium]|nr:ComF family protein [Lachnospiraceae bacterium]
MRDGLTRLLFPRKCPGCGIVLPTGALVCEECSREFTLIKEPACMICGRPLEYGNEEMCYTCANSTRSNSFGVSIFIYDDLMRNAMSGLKFHGQTDNVDYFAAMAVSRAGAKIRSFEPCALVPVPVHKTRLEERGYNQAELICEKIGEMMEIPVVSDWLIRARKTDFQKNLGSIMRRRNLEGAFALNEIDYPRERVESELSRVMIVDDIYTTGTTMENCASKLKEAGVTEIGLLNISIGAGI